MVIPMTQAVIDTIHAQAKADGMKGLKITNRQGEVLYEDATLTGVEYNEDNNDEDDEEVEEAPAVCEMTELVVVHIRPPYR